MNTGFGFFLHSKGCRFVTATHEPDGYRCKQYDKPVLSENVTTNGEVAYLHGLYLLIIQLGFKHNNAL